MQLDMFTSPPKWEPLRVADLPDIRSAKLIGLDTETKDPNLSELGPGFIRGDAHVLGYSVAVAGFSAYIPLFHYGGNVDDPEAAIRWLRDLMRCGDGVVLGANIHYDLDALRSLGIEVNRPLYDVQVVDSVIDENHLSYSLENIAQRRLNEGKRSGELKEVLARHKIGMSDLDKLDAAYVADYGERDATLLLEIHESQSKDIAEFDLERGVARENRLTRVLWEMHQTGVPVNLDKADQLNTRWKERADQFKNEVFRKAGRTFNIDSTKQLASVLESEGIILPYTSKGNPSVTNDFLKSVDDPICTYLLEYRRLNKIRKDYCEGIFLKYAVNGRIHPQWFQSKNSKRNEESAEGAGTGRITGSKPNLTQVPSRTAEGKELREVVEAEEGKKYCKLDYSSQEPRISLHFAYIAKCTGAAEARERFLKDKKTDYHDMTKDLILEKSGLIVERGAAKQCNLGLTYGMQEPKLMEQLGVGPDAARQIIQAYHQGMPYVREITNLAQEQVKKNGFIRTWGGRIRRFNKWGSTDYNDKELFDSRADCLSRYGSAKLVGLHAAFNNAVQGTAADQMKQAIINVYDETGNLPLLQVYDELGVSVESNEEAFKIAEIMENALDLEVPSLVEPSIGPNWGNTEDVA